MAEHPHAGMLAKQILAQTDKDIIPVARESLCYKPGWECLPASAVPFFQALYHAVTFNLKPAVVRSAAVKMADSVKSLEENNIWTLQEARSFWRM